MIYDKIVFESLKEVYTVIGNELNQIMVYIDNTYILHIGIECEEITLKLTKIKAFWRKYSNIILRYLDDDKKEITISLENIVSHTVNNYKSYVNLPFNRDMNDIYYDTHNGIINIGTPLRFTKISYTLDDISSIMKYLRQLVNNQETHFNQLIKWMAHIVKYPARKTQRALFIYGPTHKNISNAFVNLMKALLGNIHCRDLNCLDRIFDKFNEKISNTIIITIGDIVWSRRKKTREILAVKKLIVDDTIEVISRETKSISVLPSFSNLILTSTSINYDFIENDYKHYLLIEVLDSMKYSLTFLDNTIIQKFYSYLMDIDIPCGKIIE